MNRGFWVAPFNFTDDQVQRLLTAWADLGDRRAKAREFIKRAESVTAVWMASRPAHDTDAEIRNRAEAVRKATENLLNVLAGASTDFELRLNSVSVDERYFEQLAEEGEDDYLSPFEGLTSPKFTAALRVMRQSCASHAPSSKKIFQAKQGATLARLKRLFEDCLMRGKWNMASRRRAQKKGILRASLEC